MGSSTAGNAAGALAAVTLSFLRQYPPFEQMEEDTVRELAASLVLGYYPKDTVILAPEQTQPTVLHIIQRGTVQVMPFHADHGGGTAPLCLGPGECFSVSALLERRAVTAPYTATADTFTYQLPGEKFDELLDRSPVLRNFATRYLASMLRESRRLIKLNFTSATGEQQAMGRTLRSLVKRDPVTCKPQTPVGDVLRSLQENKVGSMLIAGDDRELLGIFTRHDVLDRVALARHDLASPISEVMTPDPLTLPAEASAYEAALLIAHRGIRHVPVCDGNRIIGVVTERDLFALQRVSVRAIHRTLTDARTVEELCKAAADIRQLARSMLGQGVAAEQLTLIISTLNDALIRQLIEIERGRFELDGIRWCWLAFGSEGRYEQTISTDQDNGLIFDSDEHDAAAARALLLPFAQAVNRALDACGFPLCKGNIMAGNPQWCLSQEEWRVQFRSWIEKSNPQALLNAVIFFDFRPVHGDDSMAHRLRDHLSGLARDGKQFQRQLAAYALDSRPPLGVISDFITERSGAFRGTIDLKKNGARLFTDAARLLALCAGVAHTNTAERLRQAGALLHISETEIASITDAFFFLQALRFRTQMAPDATAENANRIDPEQLNEIDRRILKESFRQARKLQSRLALDYQL